MLRSDLDQCHCGCRTAGKVKKVRAKRRAEREKQLFAQADASVNPFAIMAHHKAYDQHVQRERELAAATATAGPGMGSEQSSRGPAASAVHTPQQRKKPRLPTDVTGNSDEAGPMHQPKRPRDNPRDIENMLNGRSGGRAGSMFGAGAGAGSEDDEGDHAMQI